MEDQRTVGSNSQRRLPIGAETSRDGTHFRVWGPRCHRIELVLSGLDGSVTENRTLALQTEQGGYFSLFVPGLSAGTRYGFRVDHNNRILPDPASRYQPGGPEGLSQLVDPRQFRWTDKAWRGVPAREQVIYEMHIGTFTREGTWQAAIRELEELARIGITVLEIMPVADFAGEFGWGYDGVNLFAPTRLYGTPDDFRQFVDRAHAAKLAVILDVVYNHFGPVGNYIPMFSEHFRSEKHNTDWGDGINFDGEHTTSVREFFRANVRYWIEEFHLDGVRFDATQDIHDDSSQHILAELVSEIRDSGGSRLTYVVAENEPQNVRMVRDPQHGGHGMDAVWNDDFHHSAMVRLTGHNEAYFSDYLGGAEEFVAAIKHGFIYQGQWSRWQENPRGTPTSGIPAHALVSFLQNHDQVANSGFGKRLDRLSSPGRVRAMTALWLLGPQTPMFFQGQEFASSAPFLYFADWTGDHAASVNAGRIKFLSQFPSLATPEAVRSFPSPTSRETFERCKLDFSEREKHAAAYALHRDLLHLRREDSLFRRQDATLIDGAALNVDCLVLRYFDAQHEDRLLIVNFGLDFKISPVPQPLLAPPSGQRWDLVWSSNQPKYGGTGTPPLEREDGWYVPGESAFVLRATETTSH